MIKTSTIAFALVAALTAGQAMASPIIMLAPYPAPGGNSASSSGNPASGTGRTWTFGGFNTSSYGNHYYGIGDYFPSYPTFNSAGPSLTMDGSRDVLSFSSSLSDLPNGKAVWTGSTVFNTYNYGSPTVPTRFTLKVTDLGGADLALTPVGSVPGTGLPSNLGAVLDVQGAFKANWLFESDGPSGDPYRASLDMFNDSTYQTNAAYSHVSSVGGAFYYTEAIPEPETYALLLAGFGFLGFAARRRKVTQR